MPTIDRRSGADSEDGCPSQTPSRSWKSILDEKLHRLHSLQFGADHALDKGDAVTALTLNLCLLGFLESECRTPEDLTFISPILHQTKQRIDATRETVASSIERNTFEQAGCKENIFKKSTNLDLGKIMESKYFLRHISLKAKTLKDSSISSNVSLLQTSSLTTEFSELKKCVPTSVMLKEKRTKDDLQDDSSSKAGKNLTQCKLTSLYGNGSTKSTVIANKQYTIMDEKKSTVDSRSNIERSRYENVSQEDEKNYSIAAKRQKASHPERSLCITKGAERTDSADRKDLDSKPAGFVTAKQKWAMDSLQKRGGTTIQAPQPTSPTCAGPTSASYYAGGNGNRNVVPKSLGMSRRGVRGNFIPPVRTSGAGGYATAPCNSGADSAVDDSTRRCLELLAGPDGELPDKLRNLEPRLIEHISNEIMDQDPNVRWDDIAGLEHAKKCVTEMVIWPLLRPDIFQGCRSPGKGLLLFGPPGTGKTMIGKAIAGEAKATFFSISASSLTSKWIGEGEKLVRALFGVASCRQPAVIFIDEIDSLLSQRKSDGEHESSRRLKTQFLIEMEGCGSGNDQLLLIGATNRPQELDEAARRRLSKRLYIPLPSAEARAWIVCNLLKKDGLFTLSEDDIHQICNDTEGYSGSDMSNLVKEASMGPLREALMQGADISKLRKEEMRPVMLQDFKNAVLHVKPSVSQTELGVYEDWNRQFGSHSL